MRHVLQLKNSAGTDLTMELHTYYELDQFWEKNLLIRLEAPAPDGATRTVVSIRLRADFLPQLTSALQTAMRGWFNEQDFGTIKLFGEMD